MASRLIQQLLAHPSALAKEIQSSRIFMVTKSYCPFCKKAKKLLEDLKKDYTYVELDRMANGAEVQSNLFNMTGQKTVPLIFFDSTLIGGNSELQECHNKGELDLFITNCEKVKRLQECNDPSRFDYDLAVIGGGSGGLACAKRAQKYGAKVVIYDYVGPTPIGTSWGLGGTCVNVGCIPKKLFHQAAIVGETLKEQSSFGWEGVATPTHSWNKLVKNVNNYIRSLNFGYSAELRKAGIKYKNEFATLRDPHTIVGVPKNGGNETITTAKFVVLATGERPMYPGVEGDKECCITSDDLFSLRYSPGKTLVIGASYVALECAGFLKGLGYDTTVMVRSILLRGFDNEMAEKIGAYMEDHGVNFIKKATPEKFELLKSPDYTNNEPGLIRVTYKQSENSVVSTEEFNTVILAVGRQSVVNSTKASDIGITLDSKSHVVGLANSEMTQVANVFAVGDILSGKPQLTPVAIASGVALAERLFNNESFDKCNYNIVPTTVFTPLEYGCIGLSEEDARKQFKEDISVFHSYVSCLESKIRGDRNDEVFYAKLITRPSLNNKVIGFHVAAPNAGEITQGFALGMAMGANIKDFQSVKGIHPTCAEVFVNLTETKEKGADLKPSGC